ncbi:VQ motif-containing protein 18-like [Salvia miltiorrhiza]|uniref:VQ motif-containing protein 18-like n=1 Tax=Salvia miltiorrhiza TaxID=226208 RepID=UPI0025AD6F60|nr:VQ motif-containing protein 18-like [Salvia miltiorrhiza]
MKPYYNSVEAAIARPKLSDYSRSISKLKPKIRITHIVEPEVITTTAEDFQQLVQRLTGKPVERKQSRKKGNSIKTEGVLQERMKIEVEEIHDHTVYSNFLEDVDGFFHDMNESPLFSFRPSQINIFGEMHLC